MANKNLVGLTISDTYYPRPYTTCSTAAATAAKVVDWSGFTLVSGASILIKFTYANSVQSPTLNVNSTGAKSIFYHGAAITSSKYYWSAGDIVEFIYDGTNWVLLNIGDTNTDTKVTTTITTDTDFYVAGSSSSSTNTGTLLKGAGVKVSGGSILYASGGFFESSDNRLKDFTESIDVDLEKIAKLKKAYFYWKKNNTNRELGVSAQEIRELYPEIVREDENGYLSVAYDKLSVIALAAIDKLNEKIESLEDRLAKVESLLEKINVY